MADSTINGFNINGSTYKYDAAGLANTSGMVTNAMLSTAVENRFAALENRALASGTLQSEASVNVTLANNSAYIICTAGYGTSAVSSTVYSMYYVITAIGNTGIIPVVVGNASSATVTVSEGLTITLATPSTFWSRYTVFKIS